MTAGTLEERVEQLKRKVQQIEAQLAQHAAESKRGWRWFVGISADDPDFEEGVRLGQEWRNADRPTDIETSVE